MYHSTCWVHVFKPGENWNKLNRDTDTVWVKISHSVIYTVLSGGWETARPVVLFLLYIENLGLRSDIEYKTIELSLFLHLDLLKWSKAPFVSDIQFWVKDRQVGLKSNTCMPSLDKGFCWMCINVNVIFSCVSHTYNNYSRLGTHWRHQLTSLSCFSGFYLGTILRTYVCIKRGSQGLK